MDLTPYVDNLRHELAVAAEARGEDARALAERLLAPLEASIRLTLLDALSAAADEITRDLAPGSVEVRLRGLHPAFVVTAPPAGGAADFSGADAEPAQTPPAPPFPPGAEYDEGGTARINFRIPAALKTRVEDAAAREALSVNAWLVRATGFAVDAASRAHRTEGRRGADRYTGWVR
ncbi:hypothetical protein [Yinghuangia soli]|uniref:Toxin-antitoxin system HicB family antitoxin n=1 Tax=Yinghuangia soli TaxID=2908204 RepID=A0AA41Q7A0_9ACTN|nr:hypothetical protein [Yinghuangia soli]MCF2532893.1 hypothetical protein [Yinghuangia soli]